jgi:hypothetical protein
VHDDRHGLRAGQRLVYGLGEKGLKKNGEGRLHEAFPFFRHQGASHEIHVGHESQLLKVLKGFCLEAS